MSEAAYDQTRGRARAHSLAVRTCHTLILLAFLLLATSGFVILMAHPRLYWGEVGNDLTPAVLELSIISDNHRPEAYELVATYDHLADAPVSAIRGYEIFNQNGWARSLHFLAAWIMVAVLVGYLSVSTLSGHLPRDLLPKPRELSPGKVWRDLRAHLRPRASGVRPGPPYGTVQKCAYLCVVGVLLPGMIVTGLAMAPTVTAAYPLLGEVFGGYQSARTLHFAGFSLLVGFFVVHVYMVGVTGFRRQIRAMFIGGRDD